MQPSQQQGGSGPLALRCELVELRAIEARDAEPAFELLHGRREVLDWLVWEGPASLAQLRSEYASWRVDGHGGCNLQLAVIERASGMFAGAVTLRFAGHAGLGELGFWLGSDFWGRGLGGELVRAGAWLAFEHLQAELVQAIVFEGNLASRRALERSGFALDRELSLNLLGRSQPAWHFSVDRAALGQALGSWRPRSCHFESGAALSPGAGRKVVSPPTAHP